MAIESKVPGAVTVTYGMSKDDIAFDVAPSGEAGRYVLLGGSVWFVRPDATEEEIEACLRWLEYSGICEEVTPAYEENLRTTLQTYTDVGHVIAENNENYSIYKNGGERQNKVEEIYKEYTNVNTALFNTAIW